MNDDKSSARVEPGTLLRRVVADAMTVLLDGPAEGLLEPQIAESTGRSIESIHRLINELALQGVVTHEDSPAGYLIRINRRSPKAAALRQLLDIPAATQERRNLAERLRMTGSDMNVAYAWNGSQNQTPLVIVTVSDAIVGEEFRSTRIHVLRQVSTLLPVEPEVRIFHWDSYRRTYAGGNKQLSRVWAHGVQLLGRDPLTHEAALAALRASATFAARPDPAEKGRGRYSPRSSSS